MIEIRALRARISIQFFSYILIANNAKCKRARFFRRRAEVSLLRVCLLEVRLLRSFLVGLLRVSLLKGFVGLLRVSLLRVSLIGCRRERVGRGVIY